MVHVSGENLTDSDIADGYYTQDVKIILLVAVHTGRGIIVLLIHVDRYGLLHPKSMTLQILQQALPHKDWKYVGKCIQALD